ncbi:cytochrome c [Acidobacteria bacterium AB60]|nr:cytochrome c [Acidobacteria bacterium AB60]
MKALIRVAILMACAGVAVAAHAEQAAEVYKSKCALCHGASGDANTPAGKAFKVPPFNAEAVAKESDAELLEIAKTGKGKMPAWQGKLTDNQLKDLITYIHGLQKKS